MVTTLRPQYYYFDNEVEARQFCNSKQNRSRVHDWVYLPNFNNDWTVYNLRKDDNSALYEPYEPLDGLEVEIDIDNFQERLNHLP